MELRICLFSINILRLVSKKGNKVEKTEVKAPAPTPAKSTEIKDEDMMVAALVATIDFIDTQLTNKPFVYDGQVHSLEVSNMPSNVTYNCVNKILNG